MSNTENPHAGQGMVVLDIGNDIGALVVSTPADMEGLEIEICPSGTRHGRPDEGVGWWQGDWHSHTHSPHSAGAAHTHGHGPAWPHVAVIARRTPAGVQHSAVYPGLREGQYDLWVRPDKPTGLSVTVVGGQVTTSAWPPPRRVEDQGGRRSGF
jgi:hypothetical protein